ncbi:MAG: hypothetical protein K2P92_05145 [Bdellovibrionaceae bacterium]|nr:hypothetical protein [Pseudobdellovibrionaceae bacterium]
MSACSLLAVDEEPVKEAEVQASKPVLTEREQDFNQAEEYEKIKKYDDALSIYFKITRDTFQERDLIYDRSLLGIARIYEMTDQSEKAILALNELQKVKSAVISSPALQIALMKNHYRVTNYYQAQKIKTELDNDYKLQSISAQALFEALFNQTQPYFDRHIFDELLFIGDVQKYFIFVMETGNSDQPEMMSSLLELYYEKFLAQLDNSLLNDDIKKKLIISLMDQLTKFDRYKQLDNSTTPSPLNKFSKFAADKKRLLTERLTND